MKNLLRITDLLRRTAYGILAHDSLNMAQAAAYSAMVALFPALIVLAALLAWLPVFGPVQLQVGAFFDQILPPSVFPLLTRYFGSSTQTHTTRLLVVAVVVSLSGASSVIATLMEGLRRAEDLPNDCWGFWERRRRSFLLVPLSFIPLAVATALVMFGEFITQWLADSMSTSMRPVFYGLTLAARWSLAVAAVASVTAVLYHLGVPAVLDVAGSDAQSARPRRIPRGWTRTLPGAVVATVVWFATTLGFGWYVTRFANYNQVYGPLGAGIALLFWLYIVFLSVLTGAEFNAQLRLSYPAPPAPGTNPDTPNAIG